MAFIQVIDREAATGELAEAYQKVAALDGEAEEVLKVHSVAPRAMVAHLALYTELMFGQSELSRAEREMIAVAVSVMNQCESGVLCHGDALRELTGNDERVEKMMRCPSLAATTRRERALIDYAVALTRDPAFGTLANVERLRAAGLDDEAIHSATALIAYFNFENRIALGLGA
jgi:uncharacterized peroxidase-related enzyme